MTTYSEVGADDRDVALFLVERLNRINIWRLPLKSWVAREDGRIVAVMTFDNITYPALRLIVADPTTRPFMRVMKLWLMAYEWCKALTIPIVCAPAAEELHHFRSLMRRVGFEAVGVERDRAGNVTEIIYGYRF